LLEAVGFIVAKKEGERKEVEFFGGAKPGRLNISILPQDCDSHKCLVVSTVVNGLNDLVTVCDLRKALPYIPA
jgi:hypothetical protein